MIEIHRVFHKQTGVKLALMLTPISKRVFSSFAMKFALFVLYAGSLCVRFAGGSQTESELAEVYAFILAADSG